MLRPAGGFGPNPRSPCPDRTTRVSSRHHPGRTHRHPWPPESRAVDVLDLRVATQARRSPEALERAPAPRRQAALRGLRLISLVDAHGSPFVASDPPSSMCAAAEAGSSYP